ncbi:MAG TPA: spore germination protein [Virgibacillus sp.]|nr:spore germination protein [Virgibacillus sp.]
MFNKIFKRVTKPKENKPSQNMVKTTKTVDADLNKTMVAFKAIYNYPTNSDVSIRTFRLGHSNTEAAIFFIDTITNTDIIDNYIMNPLLFKHDPSKNIEDVIPVKSFAKVTAIKEVISEINSGQVALFMNGKPEAFIINAIDFQKREIGKAENEVVLKGPKEAFSEAAETNISLIRKQIRDENLIVESSTISKRSKNDLFIIYNKNLANEELIDELKRRVKNIDAGSIQNLPILEQYIEDRPTSLFPSMLYTERPDRATHFLENGFIVLLMDNSPDALILPTTFWTHFHSVEDSYLRFIDGNFTRILRLIAVFVTLFTSAIYVALTEYHSEMIPPDLLLAIASTRDKVPFPPVIEILVMEVAFELIREAGLKVPAPIGPTIGIVGALILGQAAVEANIVSPIVVIVVALGGLSSFAIGDISLNFAVRLIRLVMIVSASLFGVYGIMASFTMGLFYIVSLTSFGVPYFAPFIPNHTPSKDTVFRKLIQNEKFRPGYIKPKDITKK